MTYLKTRLLACAVTFATVLHPHAGHAQTKAPVTAVTIDPVTTQLPHISIQTVGKGPTIVLIPGLSSPRAVWDGVWPMLAKTHRVVLVQVNGFGGDAPGANLAPAMLDGVVADLDAYLGKAKAGPAAVVGHSLGGLIALMLAKVHPQAVSKLMIVDSLPYVGEIFVPGATVAMLEPQAKAMRDGMAAAYGRPADPRMAEATANRLAAKPASRTTVAGWFGKADARVSAAAFYEDMTTDLRPAMKGIATPITLVYPWGGAGPTKPAAEALYRRAYADAPHVTFVDIGDAAHFVMLDQPAAFAAAVAGFAG